MKTVIKKLLKMLNRFLLLFSKMSQKKKILFYCNSNTMIEHFLNYYNVVKCDKYSFYIYCKNTDEHILKHRLEGTNIKQINKFLARIMNWNLCVCADVFSLDWLDKEYTPSLYINHGTHNVVINNEEELYAYGHRSRLEDGTPRFSAMLEPSKEIFEYMNRDGSIYKGISRFTGYKFADRIMNGTENYSRYREQLGVDDNVTLVAVFGTWREYSLFHVLGNELFIEAEKMKAKGYQFIFSIHPNEYKRYDENITPLGDKVEAQRDKGFIVRTPSEDWLPYIAAADIVISDHSTLSEMSIIANKKLILLDFPDKVVWKHSLLRKAKESLPTIKSAKELDEIVTKVKQEPLSKKIGELRENFICKEHDEIVRKITYELLNNQ